MKRNTWLLLGLAGAGALLLFAKSGGAHTASGPTCVAATFNGSPVFDVPSGDWHIKVTYLYSDGSTSQGAATFGTLWLGGASSPPDMVASASLLSTINQQAIGLHASEFS